MELIGKTSIHPVVFYSGKISGYTTWVLLLLSWLNVFSVAGHSALFLKYGSCGLFLIGLLFTVMSLINLGKSTTLGLPSKDTVFKTSGIYRFSRNPMYIGFNCFTLASMLYTLNIAVILLGVYSIVIYHLIILGEEAFLEQRFHQAYTDYKRLVKRYL
ncbi:isoprenylcysteine carboxylmethyltransferase family protein [bacterium]|nr:isoprenylcysteine carboxylmethyltransferase family protein [bacterium]MBU1066012.1 isoprenylcysteine carboxylmethyltransferase family protein [bacterium]MBU1633785.1 isoprenylcysteine carboxylmethyltransferase family protein [bacterium]MBU1873599.1 isoprenylcysteine carboxylmethyltransferase family protein [bacterium]